MDIKREAYGTAPEGRTVELFTLTNDGAMRVGIINWGGTVVSLEAPDRDGAVADVVLGFDSLEGYIANPPYFGAIIGRYGNRIAEGRFTLGGKEYALALNNGTNHLHGGTRGFDKYAWDAEPVSSDKAVGLRLTRTSPDGEEGYPGNLQCTVTYWLTDQNELRIDYEAQTDQLTIVNLTNHSYFNLAGHAAGDILGHELYLDADHFTPISDKLVPTGEIRAVAGTPLDFTKATVIGKRINEPCDQLKWGLGYDHNFVLNRGGRELALAGWVYEPKSGRMLEVLTTEPGMQFYAGNFLDGTLTGKGRTVYQQRHGFCLETQHFPNSPNIAGFPSTELTPGQTYRSTTVYRFRHR